MARVQAWLACSVCLALLVSSTWATMVSKGNLHYPDSTEGCDFATESCAPLSDVWGYVGGDGTHYAVVGVANGVSFVDVEQPSAMEEVDRIGGCITEWRDMKVYEDVLYVVNDFTQLCNCTQQPCQQLLSVEYNNITETYRAEEGKAMAPLSAFGDMGVSGPTAYTVDNTDGCNPFEDNSLSGMVALVDRGNCMFSEKALNAQSAGAVGIVVVNERQDVIYPSMGGENTGVDIPGLLIGSDDGGEIKSLLSTGVTVVSTLSEGMKEDSSLYSAPDGLVIVDMSDPTNVSYTSTTEFFNFAHNLLIDPDRPYAYTCGQDTLEGGVVVYDITDPREPVQWAYFDEIYIHDIEVVKRQDVGYVLYAAGIYNSTVLILDVNEIPEGSINDKVIQHIDTIDMPHNTAQTEDDRFLYVSHEADAHPVTIWNVEDLDNIEPAGEMSVHVERSTIPHNVYINGDLMWMSYYSEGVVSYDISENPANPILIGHYDTSPFDTGFHGVWGIYPFVPDNVNVTYASDIEAGLFYLELIDYDPVIEANVTGGNGAVNSSSSAGGDHDSSNGFRDAILWVSVGVGVVVLLLAVIVFAAVLFQRYRIRKTSASAEAGQYDMEHMEDVAYDDE